MNPQKKKIANCPSQVKQILCNKWWCFFPLNSLSSRDFPETTVPRPEAGETSRDGASLEWSQRWRITIGIHGSPWFVMILFELRVQSSSKKWWTSMFFSFFYPICLPIWWVFFPSKLQKSPEVQTHGIV